jgi:hypothetical protein
VVEQRGTTGHMPAKQPSAPEGREKTTDEAECSRSLLPPLRGGRGLGGDVVRWFRVASPPATLSRPSGTIMGAHPRKVPYRLWSLYGTSGPRRTRSPEGTTDISRWRKPPERCRNGFWAPAGAAPSRAIPSPLPGLNPILVASSGGLRHRLISRTPPASKFRTGSKRLHAG